MFPRSFGRFHLFAQLTEAQRVPCLYRSAELTNVPAAELRLRGVYNCSEDARAICRAVGGAKLPTWSAAISTAISSIIQRLLFEKSKHRSPSAPGAFDLDLAYFLNTKKISSNFQLHVRLPRFLLLHEEEIADYEREEGEALKKTPAEAVSSWATLTEAVRPP